MLGVCALTFLLAGFALYTSLTRKSPELVAMESYLVGHSEPVGAVVENSFSNDVRTDWWGAHHEASAHVSYKVEPGYSREEVIAQLLSDAEAGGWTMSDQEQDGQIAWIGYRAVEGSSSRRISMRIGSHDNDPNKVYLRLVAYRTST